MSLSKAEVLKPRRRATKVYHVHRRPWVLDRLTESLEIAKDSNLGIGDRATAAKDALGNKVDESQHDVILPSSAFLSLDPY